MKILIYGIHFFPDSIGIARYSWEMAEWLASRGHEVRCIMPPPYYPEWRLSQEHKTCRYQKEIVSGVQILRCPLWIPKKPSGLNRVVYQTTFAFSTLPVLYKQSLWCPDVVMVIEPPLLCAPIALFTAWISHSKTWLHVQDYEVDMAFDLGLLNGLWLRKTILWLEGLIKRRFQRVSSISIRMLEKAKSKTVQSQNLIYFPNWVNLRMISPLADVSKYRKKLNISENTVVGLYAGNMGAKQGIETLAQVAGQLADIKDLLFVFCGNGPGRMVLESASKNLNNVRFLDLQPAEHLNELLGLADIHLLPQRAGAADSVMPSKLTGMMASGRSIVVAADRGTELANVIQNIGLVVPPGDINAFTLAVKRLAASAALRSQLGEAARRYAERNLDKEVVLRGFEENMLSLINLS